MVSLFGAAPASVVSPFACDAAVIGHLARRLPARSLRPETMCH